MIDNLDFENEFISDEEVDETIESLIDLAEEQTEARDNEISIMNPKRVQAVLYTYKILKYLTRGAKTKVTYELNEPCKSMGSVSIIGKELTFSNPEWFMVAVKLSSNFNVYPKTDGTVQMDFTFHGLTMPFDLEEEVQ